MSSGGDPSALERLQNSEMALEALANVMKHNKGVDIQCIGHFKLLFFLLRLSSCPRVQEMALSVLNNVTGNRDCVDDIAANSVLVSLLAPLYSSPTTGDTGQQLSTGLVTNSNILFIFLPAADTTLRCCPCWDDLFLVFIFRCVSDSKWHFCAETFTTLNKH